MYIGLPLHIVIQFRVQCALAACNSHCQHVDVANAANTVDAQVCSQLCLSCNLPGKFCLLALSLSLNKEV